MKDEKPSMRINVKGQRFYYSNKRKKVLPSKNVPVEFYGDIRMCREELIARFQEYISDEDISVNPNNGNSYIIKFLPHYIHPRTKKNYSGEFTVDIIPDNMHQMRYFSGIHKDRLSNLTNLLSIVVGLTDVVLYHNDNRLESKKSLKSLKDYVTITEDYFRYSGCCSEVANNPFTFSLMLGLIRDCYMIVIDDDIDEMEFINKFNMKDIFKIIKECDYVNARNLITKEVIPYFNSPPVVGVYRFYEQDEYDEEEEEWIEGVEDWWEDSDDGDEECNILGASHIYKAYLSLLNGDINKFSDNAIENYDKVGWEFGVGIAQYYDWEKW